MPVTRVLICEDSKTYTAALRRALEHDSEIKVVNSVASAEEAVAAVSRCRPDVITMDIELPGMSGLQGIEQIMGTDPCPILIISSHLGSTSAAAAAGLAAGALDAVSKESLDVMAPSSVSAVALRARLKQLSHVRVIRHPRARLAAAGSPVVAGRTASVIGVCASTGGPQALCAVLSLLPGTFRIPVLVVQHITAGFHEGLARWLDDSVPLDVRMADAGVPAAAGIWIAPGGAHLRLGRDGTLILDEVTPAGRHRPSGDVLLTSVAEVAGHGAVAVVLSGMGRDGAIGARAVSDAGGTVLAQDEESSAVWGMPKAAAEEGRAAVLPLVEIGSRLRVLRLEPLRK
jgi:two-component system, chemotaxis family, protein-glutamate methylesterase/glutaminase